MDSISRTALLALLNDESLTREQIIELVQNMQPLEVDGVYHAPPATQCCAPVHDWLLSASWVSESLLGGIAWPTSMG